MVLTVCLFLLGFGMSAGANVNAPHKSSSEMSKKKAGKHKGGKKVSYHHKKTHYR
jgi:hypothetical protein